MEIRQKLEKFYTKKNIPNIILYGPCNSGKKTLLFEFLHKLYKNDKQKIKQNIMISNCSHGKGIKFVREDLKTFAKSNILYGDMDVQFKSVVLLNAQSLTNDAQSALRRCIEVFNHNTRFFVVLEDKNKLLKPILSRFCDIYVPFISKTITTTNPHDKWFKDNIDKWFHVRYNSTESDMKSIVKMTNHIYESGISALDVIAYINNLDYIKSDKKAEVVFKFEEIKSNFKFEKLTIFYILQSMFC